MRTECAIENENPPSGSGGKTHTHFGWQTEAVLVLVLRDLGINGLIWTIEIAFAVSSSCGLVFRRLLESSGQHLTTSCRMMRTILGTGVLHIIIEQLENVCELCLGKRARCRG